MSDPKRPVAPWPENEDRGAVCRFMHSVCPVFAGAVDADETLSLDDAYQLAVSILNAAKEHERVDALEDHSQIGARKTPGSNHVPVEGRNCA